MTERTVPLTAANLTPLTEADLAMHLGLVGGGRVVGDVGLARLQREAIRRWGAPRRRDVMAYVRKVLWAVGQDDEETRRRSKDVLQWLEWRRDIQEVTVEGTPHLLPCIDRVVSCGELSFVIGCGEVDEDLDSLPGGVEGAAALTRWLFSDTANELARSLDGAHEIEEWSVHEWIGPPTWRRFAENRGAPGVDLGGFWRLLRSGFEEQAAPATGARGVRVIAGEPGQFFGRSHIGEARWRDAGGAEDGIYCGARPGYQDEHLHPALVEIRGGEPARMMDLYDWDEQRWALLARGEHLGAPERLRLEPGVISQTCQLPHQLLTALQCLCEQDKWAWRCPQEASQSLAEAVASVGGLELVQV